MMNRQHSTTFTIATALVLLACCGCRGNPSDENVTPALEAVDVEPSLEITTTDDPQEVKRAPELVGILPEDFPNGLPLLLPASLVDFGSRDGSRYVSLLTPASRKQVDRQLSELVRRAGWSVTPTAEGKQLRKGAQQVRLRFENARPGTFYHFEY